MEQRKGTYVINKVAGESVKAYVPQNLPPKPPLNLESLYPQLEKATQALAQLNAITTTIPNTSLFIYMAVRKEALLSSQIEGTQSSFSDLMLFENDQSPEVSLEDVQEVSHYVSALGHGLKRMKEGFPLSLRLLREMHSVLLSGGRGATKLPGEFRRSQNWIGGTRPGNALFVPPPVEQMDKCLANLEEFLHDSSLPGLIKAGVAHVQFETIHPFLDGNGRLGRLLIVLLLCENKMLTEPVLYMSLYLKQNRNLYYDLLQQVRLNGTWETWLEFFLEGVCNSAKQAALTAQNMNNLFEKDRVIIESLGRVRFSCLQIFEHLKKLPQVTPLYLSKQLNLSLPTLRLALNAMAKAGILQESTGKLRNKIYVYHKYLQILEEGAQPFKQ